MKELIHQYGQTVLACVAAILIMGLTIVLLKGPIGTAIAGFTLRVF